MHGTFAQEDVGLGIVPFAVNSTVHLDDDPIWHQGPDVRALCTVVQQELLLELGTREALDRHSLQYLQDGGHVHVVYMVVWSIGAACHRLIHGNHRHPFEVATLQITGCQEPQRHVLLWLEACSNLLGVLVQERILFKPKAHQFTCSAVDDRLGHSMAEVQQDSTTIQARQLVEYSFQQTLLAFDAGFVINTFSTDRLQVRDFFEVAPLGLVNLALNQALLIEGGQHSRAEPGRRRTSLLRCNIGGCLKHRDGIK